MIERDRIGAAVLAGGRSRRMGHDKRRVTVDGVSLLERAIGALHAVPGVRGPIAVVGDLPPVPSGTAADGSITYLSDEVPDAGPLAGLAAALRVAEQRGDAALLVVGVDHPWLDVAVLAHLVDELLHSADAIDAALLVTARGPQPLLAAYRPGTASAAVAALLAVGERRLRVVADHLDVLHVEPGSWRQLDRIGASAVDVDDPDELARAVAWMSRARATTPPPPGTGRRRDLPRVSVQRVIDGAVGGDHDIVIGEEPLEIRAAGPGQEPVTLMTTLRTPGSERELAAGWVLAEGLAAAADILDVEHGDPHELMQPEDTVTVRLRVPVDPALPAHRHAVATASCGLCGRASIEELVGRTPRLPDEAGGAAPLPWELLAALPDELLLAQGRFQATGGVHATGLFDRDGRLVTWREDVGRHNALDAAIGAHVLGGVWPADGLLDLVCVLSGRIGFELVAKAATARLPIVVAVGAASDLAVRTAERLGITLVGFLRDGGGTVYTHAHRLALPG